MDSLYRDDFEKFIEYNIRDVEVLVNLDKKLLFLFLVNEMKEISTSPAKYFNFQNTTKFVDAMIYKCIRIKKNPLVMRTRPDIQSFEKFSGADVRKPLVGFHNWIIDLDAASMYPSIIRSLNISPETWMCRILENYSNVINHIRPYLIGQINTVPPDVQNVQVVFMNGQRERIDIYNLKNILFKLANNSNDYLIASNGAIFSNTSIGIVPEIQQELSDNRKKYKDLKKVWGYFSKLDTIKNKIVAYQSI